MASPSTVSNSLLESRIHRTLVYYIGEIGDGACGFRALSRHLLYNDPRKHAQVRSEVLELGVNTEYLNIQERILSNIHRMTTHPSAYIGERT